MCRLVFLDIFVGGDVRRRSYVVVALDDVHELTYVVWRAQTLRLKHYVAGPIVKRGQLRNFEKF
jgi:hypothetical protein